MGCRYFSKSKDGADMVNTHPKESIRPIHNNKKLLDLVLKWLVNKKYIHHNDNIRLQDNKEELAILLTTGSLNPIHTGHIDMMNFAKDELERLDNGKYRVIGGFMSPSHDGYVSTKASYIRSYDRIEMTKLAVKDSLWIECDEWECNQKDFIDFPQVCQAFSTQINSEQFQRKIREYIRNNYKKYYQNYINEKTNKKCDNEAQKNIKAIDNGKYGKNEEKTENINIDYNNINLGKKINVFYVCGRDSCDECRLWNGVYGYNGLVAKTLVVPRPDFNNSNNSNNKIKNGQNCIVVNVPPLKMIDDRSSTQIRKYIEKSNGKLEKFHIIKKEIVGKKLLHPNVLEYIEKNLNDLVKQLKDKNWIAEKRKSGFDKIMEPPPDIVLELTYLNKKIELFDVNFKQKWNIFVKKIVNPYLIESPDKFAYYVNKQSHNQPLKILSSDTDQLSSFLNKGDLIIIKLNKTITKFAPLPPKQAFANDKDEAVPLVYVMSLNEEEKQGDVNIKQHKSCVNHIVKSKLSSVVDNNKKLSKLKKIVTKHNHVGAGVGGRDGICNNNTLCYHIKLDLDHNNEMKHGQAQFKQIMKQEIAEQVGISHDCVQIDSIIDLGYAYGIYLQITIDERGTIKLIQDTVSQQHFSLWFINKCIEHQNLDKLFQNKSKVSCMLRCHCFSPHWRMISKFLSAFFLFFRLRMVT